MKIMLDTNILIDHLCNLESATEYLISCINNDIETWVCSVTVMELYAAPALPLEQQANIGKALVGLTGVASIDREIALVAGQLLGRYRKEKGLNPVDALIAATAITMDAVLVTRNSRHFEFIDSLVVSIPY